VEAQRPTGYDGVMLRRCLAGFLLATVAACPSPSAVVDAGAPDAGAVVVDAGTVAVVDAGTVAAIVDAGSVPVVETLVDAGTMADGPPSPPTTVKPDTTHPVTGFIHDRLLVKPKDSASSASAIERMVEKQLGAKVQLVRRTAGTFWLVQLAPTSPPRTKQDQERAVARLKKSGTFVSVEGDQLMTIKAGFGAVPLPMPMPMVNR
jgi:hypothetical protein